MYPYFVNRNIRVSENCRVVFSYINSNHDLKSKHQTGKINTEHEKVYKQVKLAPGWRVYLLLRWELAAVFIASWTATYSSIQYSPSH